MRLFQFLKIPANKGFHKKHFLGTQMAIKYYCPNKIKFSDEAGDMKPNFSGYPDEAVYR